MLLARCNLLIFVLNRYVLFEFCACRIEKSGWSLEGLKTESVMREGSNVTLTCSSTHLTSFAVLVDVGGAKVISYLSFKCVSQE